MKQGFIKAAYMDHMGSDLTVVNAARVSFDKASGWIGGTLGVPYPGAVYQERHRGYLPQSDANLIRFLASGYRTREWEALLDELSSTVDRQELDFMLKAFKDKAQHWAPFAHPVVQIRMELPIFLARQFVKHQVGGVWSELSRRYVDGDLEFWFPEEWHERPADIKQGSGAPIQAQEFCTDTAVRVTKQAEAAYAALRAEGVSPEEARTILPQNLMTTVVWTGSLLFWARVCNQRLDGHAQLAAQELGDKIYEIIRPLFPVSWAELIHA